MSAILSQTWSRFNADLDAGTELSEALSKTYMTNAILAELMTLFQENLDKLKNEAGQRENVIRLSEWMDIFVMEMSRRHAQSAQEVAYDASASDFLANQNKMNIVVKHKSDKK